MPLQLPPGHAQADFGEAWTFIGGVKQKVHFFAFDLPHGDASYVRAYPAAVNHWGNSTPGFIHSAVRTELLPYRMLIAR